MNTKQLTKGFTIIEVVLVLAIAGLIFLMVFVALPALQSGQRDTARKNDVGSVATAVSNYTANNRGNFPSSSQLRQYATDVSTNTSQGDIESITTFRDTVVVKESEVKVVQGAKCSDTGKAGNDGNASQKLVRGTKNQFVVITFLESGGGTSFCQDS